MSTPSAGDFAGERVLVTGGAGFIGSHLSGALVARGAVVRVLDDFSNGRDENLEPIRGRIEVVRGDIRDAEACQRAVEGVRTVFHLAALGSVPRSIHDPATSFAVNVGGTVNVFAAARRAAAARVVYASSSSVYGDSAALPKREGEEGEPLSPYALSKVRRTSSWPPSSAAATEWVSWVFATSTSMGRVRTPTAPMRR